MIEAQATAKYIRTSAQKAGLVMDLIRGRGVNQALATLRFSRKRVARDIEKVLRSAIANAQQKPGFGGDADVLVVSACYADQGPTQKRVRPAPMGRAYRVVKRTAHLTVKVKEREGAVLAETAGEGTKKSAARSARTGKVAAEPNPAPAKQTRAARPKAAAKAKKGGGDAAEE